MIARVERIALIFNGKRGGGLIAASARAESERGYRFDRGQVSNSAGRASRNAKRPRKHARAARDEQQAPTAIAQTPQTLRKLSAAAEHPIWGSASPSTQLLASLRSCRSPVGCASLVQFLGERVQSYAAHCEELCTNYTPQMRL